jgi:hypothetical protein
MKQFAATLLLACWAWGGVAAAPIYRCGPDGRQYSQTPCPGGTLLEASDPRSAAQRAAARKVVEEERRQGAEMQRERRAQQAAAQPAQASGFDSRAQPAELPASGPAYGKHKKTKKSKAEQTSDFIAVEPGARKKASPR